MCSVPDISCFGLVGDRSLPLLFWLCSYEVSPRAGWMFNRLVDVGTSLAVGYLGRCPPPPACPPCPACSLSCASLACSAAPPCPACPAAAFQAPAEAEPAPAAAPPPVQAGAACAACEEAPCVCWGWAWLVIGIALGVFLTLAVQACVSLAQRIVASSTRGKGSGKGNSRALVDNTDTSEEVAATPSSLRRRYGGSNA